MAFLRLANLNFFAFKLKNRENNQARYARIYSCFTNFSQS